MWELYLVDCIFFMNGLGMLVMFKIGFYNDRVEMFLLVVFVVEFCMLVR